MIDRHRTKSCQIRLKSLKRKGFGGFFIPENPNEEEQYRNVTFGYKCHFVKFCLV